MAWPREYSHCVTFLSVATFCTMRLRFPLLAARAAKSPPEKYGSHGRPQEREVPDASRARSVRAGLRADEGRHRESRRAAPPDQYSRWDEYVAIHRFIQNANTPATNNVNFGHGGLGRVRISVVASLLPAPPRAAAADLRARRDASLLGLDRSGRHDRRSRISWDRTAIRFRATRSASATSRPRRPARARTRRRRRHGGPPDSPAGTCTRRSASGPGALRRNIQPPAGLPSIATLRSALDKGDLLGVPERARVRRGHGAVPPAAQRPARLVRRRRPHGQRRGLAVRSDVLPASLQLRSPLGDVADGRPCRRVPGRRRRPGAPPQRSDVPVGGRARGLLHQLRVPADRRCPTSPRSA